MLRVTKTSGAARSEQIKTLLEAILETEIGNTCRSINISYEVQVADGEPSISVYTDSEDIRVLVETKKEGESFYFDPYIYNETKRFTVDTSKEAVETYKKWASIAEVCQKIFEIEFRPEDYID